MIKPYSCLIIGLGQVGLTYDLNVNNKNVFLSHAKSIHFHKNFSLDAAVEINKEKIKIFTKVYKTKAFSSVKEAATYKNYSVIIISVPTEHHYKIFQDILKYCKPKLILCEKPISYKLKEVEFILKNCKKSKIDFFVNYIRRADPACIKIKSKIQSMITRSLPLKGICWYNKGLLHSGLHYLDLCSFWLGSIKKITRANKIQKINYYDYSLDFIADFEGGQVTFLSWENNSFSMFSLEILTSDGRIRYDHEGNLAYLNPIKNNIFVENYLELNQKKIIFKSNMNQCQFNLLNEISNFLENKSYNLSSGETDSKVLKSLSKIIEN
mgnify:FL=1